MSTVVPHRLSRVPLAVSTRGLVKRFKGVLALDGIDLRVPDGAVYVLAGGNGAGKTTLIQVLLDLVPPDAGAVEVFGLDTSTQGPQVRARIGYVSASDRWEYPWMLVADLMRYHAAFFPTWDRDYAARLARAFELPLDRKVGALSRGFARRVQLVLALAHRPPLLLLDEPTDGLDRVVRDELLGLLAEHLAEAPTTVLVSTHQIHEIDPLVDHLGILRNGRIVAQLSRDHLHRTLRRYHADVSENWVTPEGLNEAVVQRAGSGRELQWVVWGEQTEVAHQFARSGATLREVRPLTLDAAVLALLRR